jgi:glutamate synthase (NADPH/NADH) large chain
MPRDPEGYRLVEDLVGKAIAEEGLQLIGWREVPVDSSDLGESVKATEPLQRQIFVGLAKGVTDEDAFERRLFLARKVISNAVYDLKDKRTAGYYPVSLSSRTLVYKGMVLVTQLGEYYRDLQDPRFTSALALVHQRFATNTFPSWQLAHPYRMIAHNGEINTLRGNVNWMAARQASVDSELFGNDISKLWPISYEGQSDTACFDNALEFLVRGGYPLAHAMMMLSPRPGPAIRSWTRTGRAFYEYHGRPHGALGRARRHLFTDGRQIGATLDRNGLRPARYIVTDDGLVVAGVRDGRPADPRGDHRREWRLQPGKMLLIDLEQGRIVSDDEIKQQLSNALPYREWLGRTQIVWRT